MNKIMNLIGVSWSDVAIFGGLAALSFVTIVAQGIDSPYYGPFSSHRSFAALDAEEVPLPPLPPEAGALPVQPPAAQPTLW